MPNSNTPISGGGTTSPDFIGLVKFLLQPFLEEPTSLTIDCERLESTQKIWIRVAFSGTDKGKVFGRGGRNLQAIRTVLETTANLIGKSLHFDVYGSHERDSDRGDDESGERSRHQRNFDGNRNKRKSDDREGNREESKPVRRSNDSKPQRKPQF